MPGEHLILRDCFMALGEALRALEASRQSIYRVRPSMDPDRLDSKGRLKRLLEDPDVGGGAHPVAADTHFSRSLYETRGPAAHPSEYEPQPEGGEATEPAVGQRRPPTGEDVATGASAGSNVDAPEPPAEERERDEPTNEYLADELRAIAIGLGAMRQAGVGALSGSAGAEEVMRLAAARLRAPQGEPDPDRMEAWADWYQARGFLTYPLGSAYPYPTSYYLRQLARAHRDATGDTP